MSHRGGRGNGGRNGVERRVDGLEARMGVLMEQVGSMVEAQKALIVKVDQMHTDALTERGRRGTLDVKVLIAVASLVLGGMGLGGAWVTLRMTPNDQATARNTAELSEIGSDRYTEQEGKDDRRELEDRIERGDDRVRTETQGEFDLNVRNFNRDVDDLRERVGRLEGMAMGSESSGR